MTPFVMQSRACKPSWAAAPRLQSQNKNVGLRIENQVPCLFLIPDPLLTDRLVSTHVGVGLATISDSVSSFSWTKDGLYDSDGSPSPEADCCGPSQLWGSRCRPPVLKQL